jgi:hypothetical protein
MPQKSKKILIFFILGIIILSVSINVKAEDQDQEPNYQVGFDVGTELVWEVTELDSSSFRNIFGFEPNFEKGDQIRIIIRSIDEVTIAWAIKYEFWDYKTDWGIPGEEITLSVFKNPENYNDFLFSLSPVEDYLQAVISFLPSEYTLIGSTIIKRSISDLGKEYRWDKEYDVRGIPVVESCYDEFDQILVKVEGTFRIIPFGLYFIGFMVAGIIGILTLILRRKRFIISN